MENLRRDSLGWPKCVTVRSKAMHCLVYPQKQEFGGTKETERKEAGKMVVSTSALAGQESLILDSWKCKDLRGCEVFALMLPIHHPLPTAGGGELLNTGVRELSETRPMRHDAGQLAVPRLAHTWKQAAPHSSSGEAVFSLPPNFWLQMVQEKWEETRGRRWV